MITIQLTTNGVPVKYTVPAAVADYIESCIKSIKQGKLQNDALAAALSGDQKALLRSGIKMRELQKQYFRTRDKGVLVQSMEAEELFDQQLAKFTGTAAVPPQGNLFSDQPLTERWLTDKKG